MSKPKRGQNQGSNYQLADGTWRGAISLGSGHRKYFSGRTKRSVETQLSRAKYEHDQGLPTRNDRITVGQFLDRWLAEIARPKVRPLTFQRYESLIRVHVKPFLGTVPLTKLDPDMLQRHFNQCVSRGSSPQSVAHLRAVMRSALNHALRCGYVGRNVAALTQRPHIPEAEVTILSPVQAREFLSAVEADRLGVLYGLALLTGMRQGELLGLRWEDVDLDAGTVEVRYAMQLQDGEYRLVEPKTKRSRRKNVLPQVAIGLLSRHRTLQATERLKAGSRWHDNDLVFTTRLGTPLDGRNATRHLRKILRDSGLPEMRFQDLRHSAASLLHALGVPLRVAMEILGHSQMSTTLRVYTHVMDESRREAALAMNSVFA